MPNFVFKFQPLLDVKMQMEENLKNELGKAIRKLEEEKEALRIIQRERDQYIEGICEKSSRGVKVGKLREYNAYIAFLKEKMDYQKENIKCAQEIVDKYREQLVKVVQERKMLDKLKEKQYLRYLKEQLKLEQRINDEITGFNYSSRLVGEKDG